ncbi:MAG: NUDIX domain-containing protein [Gammaproteobacteria bacterium]
MTEGEGLQRRDVVTAFLRHGGRLLLVRRSERVWSYRGDWAGISGHLEAPTALDQVLREIREESGLRNDQVRLIAAGERLEVPAPELGTLWVVHPFLFDVDDPDAVRLDWENVEARWVAPDELPQYRTVPALAAALAACLEAEAASRG